GEIDQFLRQAESFYRHGKLAEALAEAEKARGLLEAGDGPQESRQQVGEWFADLQMAASLEELRLDAADRKVGAMHAAHAAVAFRVDPEKTDAGYARLFREYGIDVDGLSPKEAAARVAARRVRADL